MLQAVNGLKVLISSAAMHLTDKPSSGEGHDAYCYSEGYNAYCLCRALARRSIELTILAPSVSPSVTIDGARIIGMGKSDPARDLRHQAYDWLKFNLAVLAKARAIVRETEPDLVHHIFPSWIDYGYSLYPIFARDRPFIYGPILTRSDGNAPKRVSQKESLVRFCRERLLKRLYTQTLRRSARVIVSVEHALDLLPPFVRGKSETICHGVDTELFLPATSRKEGSDFKVVLIGRLIPGKGIAVAIKAISLARSAIPNILLQVAGVGPRRAELEVLARAEGVQDCVQFLNAVDHNRVPSLLRNSDVLCCPSTTDASPTVILEGMACGLPIVATNTAGIPEMLGHGKNGLLIKPNDPEELGRALVKLHNFPELARELGRNGRIDAQRRFDWNVIAERLVEVYMDSLM